MSGSLLFAQEAGSQLQILGSFALGYASNSDINDAAAGVAQSDADYYNSIVAGDPFSVDSSKANFTYGFDLDLRYFFGNIGIGAEVGYHTAKAKSEVTGSNYVDKTTTTIKLDVIPVVATVYYKIPVGEASNNFLLVGAGLGYYSGKLDVKYEDNDTIVGDTSYTLKGDQSTIGYHALVEYDYVINSGITFFTGVKVRYVQFDKFEKSGAAITYAGDNISGGLTGINWYIGAGISI